MPGGGSRVGLRDVRVSYRRRCALDGVTLTLDPGVTVLLGRNGAGKTTLCKTLVGAIAPDSGEVLVDGTSIRDPSAFKARLGWMPQDIRAPAHLEVRSWLVYAAWLKGLGRAEAAAAADLALEQVDLTARRHDRIGRLSGGMVRRLGLAVAIVNAPSLLVLDEPTAGLDPEQRDGFYRLLSQRPADQALLVSTHSLEDVAEVGGRVAVLDAGRLVFTGGVDELAIPGGPDASPHERLRHGFLDVLTRSDTA